MSARDAGSRDGQRLFAVALAVLLSASAVGPMTAAEAAADSRSLSVGEQTAATADAATGTIETEHFRIEYSDGHRSEAETVASFADDYYEVLLQQFGVPPSDDRVSVVVGEKGDLECETTDAQGCYVSGVDGTIYLGTDARSVFYHELVHWLQAESVGDGSFINPPGAIETPQVMVEGTATYLDSPAAEIARGASFSAAEVDFAETGDLEGDEYDDYALFAEFVLREYGREGFDVLFSASHPRALEAVTDEEYSEIRERFADQLSAQEGRMADGGAVLPGFTHEPFVVEAGDEVTVDASTPEAIEALDRAWYNGDLEAVEWDVDGDGEVESSGESASFTVDDPTEPVTMYATVDGETYEVERRLLVDDPPEYAVESVTPGDGAWENTNRGTVDAVVVPGQTATVDVAVANDGEFGDETSVELVGDGELLASERVDVGAGERATAELTFELPADTELGTHSYDLRTETSERELRLEVAESPTLSFDEDRGIGLANSDQLDAGASTELVLRNGIVSEDVTQYDGLDVAVDVGVFYGDTRVATRTLPFEPGWDTQTVEVPVVEESGDHELRVEILDDSGVLAVEDGELRTDVTVTEAPVPDVESVDVESPVSAGEEFPVGVDVTNDGDLNGEVAVEVTIGDETVTGSRDVDAGETETVWTSAVVDEPGTYDVRVDGTVLSEVDVEAAESTTTDDASTGTESTANATADGDEPADETATQTPAGGESGGSVPGFGVWTAGVALAVVAVHALRR
ncbi:hypothetical protein [Halobacterium yunchengense]|uniref:hypothetical protein n=1 Tax=Halobacterium yunchengense TaxID=3108497 RepID=UPI0030087F6C